MYRGAAVENELNRLLALRVNTFSPNVPASWTSAADDSHINRMSVFRNWMYMVPELGAHLRTNALALAQQAVDNIDYCAPYWWVSHYMGCLQESTTQYLHDHHVVLQARAWVLQEPYEELVKYLDAPAFKVGDLYYIHDLVTVIEAQPSGNLPPTVDAGTDQQIVLPDNNASLNGTVTDDGLPNPPGAITQTWTRQSGPGTVTFANANAVDTSATFSINGVYVLRLTAGDSELTNYDQVTITVTAPVSEPDLVGWWQLEQNANDSAGENHGTLSGTPDLRQRRRLVS